MEKRRMNALVPPDQLHWSAEMNSYTLLSKKETEDLIGACLRTGLEDIKEIMKVVIEYEKVRSGQLLFDQLLAGNIGIYEFDEEGSPVFESIRKDSVREIGFKSSLAEDDEGAGLMIDGRSVFCDTEAPFDAFKLYRGVVGFCSRWGIDILGGENPEEESITREDPEFIADLRRRTWRVMDVKKDGDSTMMRITYTGHWLRTSQ